ncbi:hypothetical protein D3C72_151180 [compost metagenome]
MVARYKRSINQATTMLQIIIKKKLTADALVDFQLFLLQKIKDGERGISRCKEIAKTLRLEKANDRPTRERSKAIDQEIKKIEDKQEQYKYIIYIWKCFGDSIPFHFCDKYALKHLLYDDQYHVKETAGFISGKDGLKNEILFLKEAAKHDVPAVLCDLTNTLRHGDVCLLGASDPFPIEIKSSPKLSSRGAKQVRSIFEINSFFVNDKAENFRNIGPVLRRELIGREKNHLTVINECIARSYSEGTSIVSPEKGIHYGVITTFREGVLDPVANMYTQMIILNDFKNMMSWHPYIPFTLLLDPQHVYRFINGDITILIFLDLQIFKRKFKKAGMHINFLEDHHWYAQISETGDISKGGFRVSRQSFLRLAFEFQSFSWALKQNKKHLRMFLEEIDMPGRTMEIPKDWLNIDDGIPT